MSKTAENVHRSRVAGHQWRPTKVGVARLMRVRDFENVAEVHRLASGFRAWFGKPALETSRRDYPTMVAAKQAIEEWLCAR